MTEADQKQFVPKETPWCCIDGRGDAWVVPSDCIQYDVSAQPIVLIFANDGWESLDDARNGGRSYLRPARVELLRALEPGLLLVNCRSLRVGSHVFRPRRFPSHAFERGESA
jgi:hypothetical protein